MFLLIKLKMRWNTLLLGRDDVIISGNIDRYLHVFVFVVEMIDILNTESINLDPEVLQNTNDYIVSRIPVGTTHQENNGASSGVEPASPLRNLT